MVKSVDFANMTTLNSQDGRFVIIERSKKDPQKQLPERQRPTRHDAIQCNMKQHKATTPQQQGNNNNKKYQQQPEQ